MVKISNVFPVIAKQKQTPIFRVLLPLLLELSDSLANCKAKTSSFRSMQTTISTAIMNIQKTPAIISNNHPEPL